MKLGIAGLGRMGAAMARRLLDTGHDLAVWNRSVSRAEPLVTLGAKRVDTPSDLARVSDIVLTSLADDPAAHAVFLGENGLLGGDISGKLFVEASTLSPGAVVAFAGAARSRGALFVESPVLGTVTPAMNGTLVALVGGRESDMARAAPLLDVLARKRIHSGEVGSASLLKLSVNLLVINYLGAVAEATALATKGGLGLELVLEALCASPAGSLLLEQKRAILSGTEPGSKHVEASVATIRKDVSLMIQLAQEMGLQMGIAGLMDQALGAACDAGLSQRDMAAFVAYQRKRLADQNPDGRPTIGS